MIVLLSDGKNTPGALRPAGRRAPRPSALRIPIYAIALGTDEGEIVETEPVRLHAAAPGAARQADAEAIARITGGRYFEAPSASDLQSIYNRLGTRLSSKQVKHEVTGASPAAA